MSLSAAEGVMEDTVNLVLIRLLVHRLWFLSASTQLSGTVGTLLKCGSNVCPSTPRLCWQLGPYEVVLRRGRMFTIVEPTVG